MEDHLARLPDLLAGHLQLTMLALLFGTAVSVPLGVLATRVAWLERVVMGVASVVQTIPGLALLAVMVPLLSSMSLSGIGMFPALIGLTLYSLLPILRNTVTGIREVDPALREAARGVGMTDRQQLRMVELPLAMPVIVAGIRTSTVWVVGTATLSTAVGAASLGNYIFEGLQLRDEAKVLFGCVAAAGLALTLDGLIRLWERAVSQRRRGVTRLVYGVLAAAYLWVGYSLVGGGAGQPVRIGTKTFTEQYILGELLAAKVRESGEATEIVPSLGSTVVFDALTRGELDVYVDYSGTIWATVMKRENPASRDAVLRGVGEYLEREHDVLMLGSLGFQNTYALAMTGAAAEAKGIGRIGDLRGHASSMKIGGDYEFFGRPEWPAIQDAYGLTFAEERSMDASLMYQAVAQGDVDVISAFSTDGRIDAFELRVLEDDRGVIPPYDAIVLVNGEFAREHPGTVEVLRSLVGTIDDAKMRALNRAVDLDEVSPAQAARNATD